MNRRSDNIRVPSSLVYLSAAEWCRNFAFALARMLRDGPSKRLVLLVWALRQANGLRTQRRSYPTLVP